MEENTKKRQTKDKIYQALIVLGQNKNVQEIKVSELCRQAHINRSTFYLHYQDINQLVEEIKTHHIKDFIATIKDKKLFPSTLDLTKNKTSLIDYQDLLAAMQQAQKEKELVTMMLGEHGDPNFYNELKKALQELLRYFFQEYLGALRGKFPAVPDDYFNIILFSVTENILLHWMEKGMLESPEEIGAILAATRIISPLSLL